MNKEKSYADRLKKMKKSIEENKDLLNEKFPDDVTVVGNPDLIKKEDSEIDQEEKRNPNDER